MRDGILFVVSAPSGAGKTSLCKEIVDFYPSLGHSVSYTTRARRGGERDGIDYHFVSEEVFRSMVDDGAFAEWAQVHDNFYGTSLNIIEQAKAAGQDLLLEIDCQGAVQIKQNCPEAVFIFILPPDYSELRKRLEKRGTDSADVIERRLKNAAGEITQAGWYDYLIINDDFSVAADNFKAIIRAEGVRASRCRRDVESIFGPFSAA